MERRFYFWGFVATMTATGAVAWWLAYNKLPVDSILIPWTDGFVGNLVSGLIAAIPFLFLTLRLGQEMEENIKKTSKIITRQNDRIEREISILRVDEFMKNDNHYDVRLPEVKTKQSPEGLTFEIRPVRDAQGKPVQRKIFGGDAYVVEVGLPSHFKFIPLERQLDYEDAPIRVGEFYYCVFSNGKWNLTQEEVGDRYEFYFSSRIDGVASAVDANEFMIRSAPVKGLAELFSILITHEGKELVGPGGATPYTFLQNGSGELFLRIGTSSPLKKVYETNLNEVGDRTSFHLVVDNFYGYGDNEFRNSILDIASKRLAERGVKVPRVQEHLLDD